MLKFGFEYSFYKSTNIRTFDPILLWLIYVYRSVVQKLWFASADRQKRIQSAYSWFQLNPALSMVKVTVLLAVQKR